MSKIPDIQTAVRALQGVRQASVRWPDPDGPATLRVEFTDDADRDDVTGSVLSTLEEIAGVDLQSLELPLPPRPAPEDEGGRRTAMEGGRRTARPVLVGLTVDREDLEASVTVRLSLGGARVVGRADGLATSRTTPRTAAEAVLVALSELLPDTVRLQLDWLEVFEASGGRPGLVQCLVTCLSPAGEETFVGSALLREDPREAAVRAILHALNRRLQQLLR